MSKTSEKNSATPNDTNFWKRFVAWGIALKRRYKRGVFFPTQLNIILFHVCSVLAIVLIVAALLSHTHSTILGAVTETLEKFLATPQDPTVQDVLPTAVNNLRILYIVVLSGIVLLTIVGGYIAANITLRPTRKALELQKRFVSNISHELRTPLAVLKTSNEVALFDVHNESVRETLLANLEEIDRMENTINTILSFDNLERSEALPFDDVSLDAVVQMALERVRDLAEKKKITLTISPPTPNAIVYGNKTALEQMALNIIKNAIIYTPKGGSVKITTFHTRKRWKPGEMVLQPTWLAGISVVDSGIGIPPESLPYIFEPFYRSNPARVRNGTGSGLGLSIVYEIVKLHEGKITVESKPEKGTSITVLLPSVPKDRQLPDELTEEQYVVSHSFFTEDTTSSRS